MRYTERRNCVYVIVTPSCGVESCFKIGQSTQVHKRFREVQTGCPFPIEYVLHLPVMDRRNALFIERGLHAAFRQFHSSGEWFLFDLTNPEHKISFREGCQAVIGPVLGDGWRWGMHTTDEAKRLGPTDKQVASGWIVRNAFEKELERENLAAIREWDKKIAA